ncbi:MAG TPA: oxidoreductase [Kineosporiaceae bacterium]|nr:oxidoreductase [Kineosporiaceae bacterium]
MPTIAAPPRWSAADIPDQTGRTAVVTGANSGLGLETTRELARHGAHVIMAVRNLDKGADAAGQIRAQIPGARLELRQLDLADLDSVRAFAAGDFPVLDLLINNAGVMMPPLTRTQQGFELQIGANHLGHFALTALLWPRLAGAPAARVVTVSSGLHKRGAIDFDDLSYTSRPYSPTGAYAQSKFANVLFGLELDRRLRAAGLPAASLLAHPGYAATNLQTSGPTGIIARLGGLGNLLFAQSAADGALPQLYAATAPEATSGQFIGPSRLGEMRGAPKVVRAIPAAEDPQVAARFWALSETLTSTPFSVGS